MNEMVREAIQKHCKTLGVDFKDACDYGEYSLRVKDCTIHIKQDHDPINPRQDYDNFGKMVCWHGRYVLGDEQPDCTPHEYFENLVDDKEPGFSDRLAALEERYYDNQDAKWFEGNDAETIQRDWIQKGLEKYYIMLPLNLYDHSGITMNVGGFSCPWDSGQVGCIFISKDAVRKEYGWKRLTKKRIEQIEAMLEGEVETYDAYLRGDCYGFEIESDAGDIDDSCWGFLGPEGNYWAMEHAMANLKAELRYRRKSRFEKIKTWIKAKVPHWKRSELATDFPVVL